MKKLKQINYSKQKLNAKVIEHFENFGVFEYSESKLEKEIKDEFEHELFDTDINDNGRFQFLIIYGVDGIDLEKSMVYSIDKKGYAIEEYKLNLISRNHNPNKPSLSEVLTEIKDKQDKRDNENEQSAQDIEETNNILNLKNR